MSIMLGRLFQSLVCRAISFTMSQRYGREIIGNNGANRKQHLLNPVIDEIHSAQRRYMLSTYRVVLKLAEGVITEDKQIAASKVVEHGPTVAFSIISK